MKMKSMMLLAVALGFGFVAMLGVRQAMSAKNAPSKTKRILVARQEIKPFSRIDQVQVAFEEYPADKVPEGAITEVVEYEGRGTKYLVPPKQPLTKSMLTDKGRYGVANLIPEGMRVHTVKVNLTQAHSGLLKMGDKIDILVTYKSPGDPRPKTKTVLEMIEVFSVDKGVSEQQDDPAEQNTKAKVENISVLVTPEQSQRLSQAEAKAGQGGHLHTTLRNPNDKLVSNTNMLTDDDFEQLEVSLGEEKKVDTSLPETKPEIEQESESEPVAETVAEPAAETVAVENTEPAVPSWVITIYEDDQVRTEEILPPGSQPLLPQPAGSTDAKTPKAPAPAAAKPSDRSPNGPSANDPKSKTTRKSPAKVNTASTGLGL